MEISEVYKKFNIPKHLQKHMLRVAAVGRYLSNYSNKETDSTIILKVLLFHDLGNLIKFDLNKGVDLFDESERNLDYWLEVQNEIVQKFGDEHVATIEMAKLIGADSRVLFLLENIGSSNLSKTIESDDWELKMCSYSDFRVTPYGFTTVTERFEDIMSRYKGRDHVLADEEKTKQKMELCLQLEAQLQPTIDVDLQELPVDQLEKEADVLLKYNL